MDEPLNSEELVLFLATVTELYGPLPEGAEKKFLEKALPPLPEKEKKQQ